MNCTVHQDRPAIHQCAACNRPVCVDCSEPKPAARFNLLTTCYRAHRLGDDAAWAGGSPTILYCKPDCSTWVAITRHNAFVAKAHNVLLTLCAALLVATLLVMVAVGTQPQP